jgi:voltage-gated potassium channel
MATGGRLSGLRIARPPGRTGRYYLLLGLLLADILVIGLAGASKFATFTYTPLTAATLLLALRTSEAHRRTMRVAWVAAGLAVIVSIAALITGDVKLNGFTYFMLFALLLASPVAILRRVVTSRHVTPRLLIGAICVYLMIGLLFTFIYLGVNAVHPSFFKQGVETEPSIYLYFSFITQATVGYGDFTPGSAVPRVLVVFEALLGQVFLVTTVARLVSLYSRASPDGEGSENSARGG